MHEVIYSAVVFILLAGGVPTAVGPCGEVLKLSESVAEGNRVVRELEQTGGLPGDPVAERGDFLRAEVGGVPR